MKITFLGTAAGIPDPDRHCSSTMIEVRDRIYIVDAGAPMVDCLRTQGILPERKSGERITAVFNTHVHSDHTVGLLHLLDACTWYFLSTTFDVFLPEPEIGEKIADCISIMEHTPFPSERLRFHKATAGIVYDDGILRATYIPTRHCEPYPSYAILIEAEGHRVLFSGDLSHRLKMRDIPTILSEEELDLFVCEMRHFTPEDLEPYLDTCRAKAVWINHFYPFENIGLTQRLAEEKKYPFPIRFARDGDIIEWK